MCVYTILITFGKLFGYYSLSFLKLSSFSRLFMRPAVTLRWGLLDLPWSWVDTVLSTLGPFSLPQPCRLNSQRSPDSAWIGPRTDSAWEPSPGGRLQRPLDAPLSVVCHCPLAPDVWGLEKLPCRTYLSGWLVVSVERINVVSVPLVWIFTFPTPTPKL